MTSTIPCDISLIPTVLRWIWTMKLQCLKPTASTSNQESLCLPNSSLLASPSPPQPMARILQGIISQSFPGGLWMETIHSTPGKGRTFAPIPSPQPCPQNTLTAPSRALQHDLPFAEQRSGLSPFLIVSSLSLFAFGTNSSQTGLSSSSPASHDPRETLHLFKEEQQLLLSPRTMAAPLPAQEETLKNHSFPPLICL